MDEQKQLSKWNPFSKKIIIKNDNGHECSGCQTPVFRKYTISDLSQKLNLSASTIKTVTIKYREPPEARIPRKHWKLFLVTGTDSYAK